MTLGNSTLTLSFIIPNAWYASTYDINFRKYLISNGFLNGITNCPKSTFSEAVVETCIIECYKSASQYIPVYSLDRSVINEMDMNYLTLESGYNLDITSTQTELKFLNELRIKNPSVADYFNVIWGIKVYEKGKGIPAQTGEESKLKSFHSIDKKSESYKPLIGGSEIFPYSVNWKGGYINYGQWIAAPRQADWFEPSQRIIIREITSKGKIHAAYIEEEAVFSNSVDVIKSKSNNIFDLKLLLGILNSKFGSYYHLRASGNSQKDVFPKILLQDLRNFPFPINNSEIRDTIILLVDKVLVSKQINPDLETIVMENEIDQLVYQLYGLTEEEIKIVEGEG